MNFVQKQYVIIVAGGVGSRMKSDLPKQFLEIGGKAIIIKTIERFLEYNSAMRVVISVHHDFKTYLKELIEKSGLSKADIQITLGGNTRFESVKNGLDLIEDPQVIVGIHDAARPLVSVQTITKCYQIAALKGNAIPCVSVNESMRKLSGTQNNFVNRNDYKIIQTPQCFLNSKIQTAFKQEYSPSFTDDATVLESTGETINLVEGNEENIKITSPHDLIIANALLNK
ncbi:2-C-methyl-D-erythritol 4-phosphate cytidylyltransferase [Sphingobacteriaceae bacterium]|nr:2-C-methyl-D-erythritol 4-phosphate cytidylyltransferase [Sphingobacteriaceae bacterium]